MWYEYRYINSFQEQKNLKKLKSGMYCCPFPCLHSLSSGTRTQNITQYMNYTAGVIGTVYWPFPCQHSLISGTQTQNITQYNWLYGRVYTIHGPCPCQHSLVSGTRTQNITQYNGLYCRVYTVHGPCPCQHSLTSGTQDPKHYSVLWVLWVQGPIPSDSLFSFFGILAVRLYCIVYRALWRRQIRL